MDKNRIEGRHGAMSWHNTAKSSGMPVEVNAEAVRWSNVQLPGEIPPLPGGGKSAEAIVIAETSRSADEHSKIAGGLTRRRAEPNGSVLTAGRTVTPPTTPDGEVNPGASTEGSMEHLRNEP